MLNITLVCKYVVHMGHWPSGFSKIKLTKNLLINNTKPLMSEYIKENVDH